MLPDLQGQDKVGFSQVSRKASVHWSLNAGLEGWTPALILLPSDSVTLSKWCSLSGLSFLICLWGLVGRRDGVWKPWTLHAERGVGNLSQSVW